MFNKILFSLRSNCNVRHTLFEFHVSKFYYHNYIVNSAAPSNVKYLLIIDFEATCEKYERIHQEIIEFPCIKLNLSNLQIESKFHYYVKPIINPTLSDFCIELTGILQEMVDSQKTFPEVLSLFEDWRQKEDLTEENSLYITSGDWDLGLALPKQCQLSNLTVPPHMRYWGDIKKIYANHSGAYLRNLISIFDHYKLPVEGKVHSGIDDSLNICRLAQKMLSEGMKFYPTGRLLINNQNQIRVIQYSYRKWKSLTLDSLYLKKKV